MHSDPIADLLTRVRNAAGAGHSTVEVPMSKIKLEIVKILEQEGFVKGYEVANEEKYPNIRVYLKYDLRRRPLIKHLRRVSKPGLRIYKSCKDLKPLRSGLCTQIVSTSQGVMTDREARKRYIGGEVICEVW
jgi:small subunit ribosomal protein S8